MNTIKDMLTVCGVAGIGFFCGYVLAFAEGKVAGKREGYEQASRELADNDYRS